MVLTGTYHAVSGAGPKLKRPLTLGVNKLKDFEAADAKIRPQFYVNSLGDLAVLAGDQ